MCPRRTRQRKYTHIRVSTAPIFLAHSIDDPIVPVQHSLVMQIALENNSIPYEIHLFKKGGHRWGLGKPNTETMQWPTLLLACLKKINILPVEYSDKK
ncbi:alpha/beta hydrolase family protein [Acinetobacter nematophilus]|uniref:alpha/beta hydrolase family protein n=1 Tax=Acinetobacter nematophilus TaxID=2994642 RepID=UPI003AF49744